MNNKKSYLLMVSVFIIVGLVVGLTLLSNPVWAAETAAGRSGLSTWTKSGYTSLDVPIPNQLEEPVFSVTSETAQEPQVGCAINTTGAISHWSLNEVSG